MIHSSTIAHSSQSMLSICYLVGKPNYLPKDFVKRMPLHGRWNHDNTRNALEKNVVVQEVDAYVTDSWEVGQLPLVTLK